jgi:hypothetical protein
MIEFDEHLTYCNSGLHPNIHFVESFADIFNYKVQQKAKQVAASINTVS